jgi:hypothetical protein
LAHQPAEDGVNYLENTDSIGNDVEKEMGWE